MNLDSSQKGITPQAKTSSNGHLTHPNREENALLLEVAYEVANLVGGIHQIVRFKAPSMISKWGERFCMVGPYIHPNISSIFEPTEDYDNPFGQAVLKMRELGFEVHHGRWLIEGRPRTILFNPFSAYHKLSEIKYLLWEHHDISLPGNDDLLNQVVAFGHLVKVLLSQLSNPEVKGDKELVAHVHEWMAATAIPEIRRDNLPVRTVFTTHATLLGRYLAQNDPGFYENLPHYDWLNEAKHFNIEAQARIERAAVHGAHVFTTISYVTARECEYLHNRKPDVIVPNGFNVKRFAISHEIQNEHQNVKELIHEFVRGHFFRSYYFDLDRTLYLFTSGRFEYMNKGFDLTLEALARLNWRMKQANLDITVVMFFITKRPFKSINPDVLQSQALITKIRQNCETIQDRIGNKLFSEVINNPDKKFPDVNNFVEDYLKLRLRRNLQSWQASGLPLPSVITHNIHDDANDPILAYLRSSNLLNYPDDRVKIVYHPDFLSTTSPLIGIDYEDFTRGCHLGVFPSFYEPWGNTPMECLAFGVPAVTSDLAGFGDFSLRTIENPSERGLYIVNRRDKSFDESANQLADFLFNFVKMSRTARISQRYKVEETAEHFSWKKQSEHYNEAYEEVLKG